MPLTPDSCTGRSLHPVGGGITGIQGAPYPAPPELVGNGMDNPFVPPPQPIPRPAYNPQDAIVFTASQDDQPGWYVDMRYPNQPVFYCGVFTAFLSHSFESHPTSTLGEHWRNICDYIVGAGNLWLQDGQGGQADPYLNETHGNVNFP